MIVIYAISTQQQKSNLVTSNHKIFTKETMPEYGEINFVSNGL